MPTVSGAQQRAGPYRAAFIFSYMAVSYGTLQLKPDTVLANFNPARVSNFIFLVNPAVTRSSI